VLRSQCVEDRASLVFDQLFEILLAGRAHLSDHIAGTLGWRKLALEGRDGRDYLKLGLSTWTFGVEFSL
jgi:hypothetical protein